MSRDYDELLKSGNNAQLEKLKENEHKRGFEDIGLYYAFKRLDEEYEELKCELYDFSSFGRIHKNTFDFSAIRKEAADIANFAHMIILKCDQELERTENRIKDEYYEVVK